MLITLAVEDVLSELVASRLVGKYLPDAVIRGTMGLRGFGYLRQRMRDFNQIALYQNPVLLLADMDAPQGCPVLRARELTSGLTAAPNLLVRIAVLEIESWILADGKGVAQWLGISRTSLFPNVEGLLDPKRSLIELARRSRKRTLREAICPRNERGTNRTGPGYNDTVGEFVFDAWDPEAARRNAPSLDRAINRMSALAVP